MQAFPLISLISAPHSCFHTARILLVHDAEEAEDIPDNETMIAAHMDDEEEDDDEEEEDLGESPVQRRRVGEDGESVAVVDGEEDDREARRKRRDEKNEARASVDNYYSGSSRGPSTAMIFMELSNGRVNKLDPATLWWAILGVTDQYMNDEMDESFYEKVVETLMDEAIALSSKTSTGAFVLAIQREAYGKTNLHVHIEYVCFSSLVFCLLFCLFFSLTIHCLYCACISVLLIHVCNVTKLRG